MALGILGIGLSGTGKSTSCRTLNPKETIFHTPNAKGLPWLGWAKDYKDGVNLVRRPTIASIGQVIQQANKVPRIKNVIIDDLTHFQNHRTQSEAFYTNEGYKKWNIFGVDLFLALSKDIETYREDLNIIIFGHTEHKDTGEIGLKTAGKLLDQQIDLPSYFTYILHSHVLETEGKPRYVFQTNKTGNYVAKTPMGYFDELYVDNDMQMIVNTIREKSK